MPDVVVLLQARLASTRLPEKVIAPFLDRPMLVYQVQRLRQAGVRVVPLVPAGDVLPLSRVLRSHGVHVIGNRAAPDDVLGRLARYARYRLHPGDLIVRACGDCPLVCPTLLTALLAHWEATPGLAYLGMGPGWPDGVADYDILTREALLQADEEATQASDREHVIPFVWRFADRFPQVLFPAPAWVSQGRPWPKLSVDTAGDLLYVMTVAVHAQTRYGMPFTWQDVLQMIQETPTLQRHYEPMNVAYVAQVAQEQGRDDITWEGLRLGGHP